MALPRILAPLTALFSLLLLANGASANNWGAQWAPPTSNKPFHAQPDQPVCRWKDNGFIGNAVKVKPPGSALLTWSCGGKTGNDIQLLRGDQGYQLLQYSATSDWQPAHTLISGDDGLCVGRVAVGDQWVGGRITRGQGSRCKVMVMGKQVELSEFKFIVTKNDGMPHENQWWNADAAQQMPLPTLRLPTGDYLCRASYAGKTWFGRTYSGTPPGKSFGRYCKITRLDGNQTVETYVSGYNQVFLNNKPSKPGAAYFAATGSTLLTAGGYGLCRRTMGGALGVFVIGGTQGGCRYGGASAGSQTYLYKR